MKNCWKSGVQKIHRFFPPVDLSSLNILFKVWLSVSPADSERHPVPHVQKRTYLFLCLYEIIPQPLFVAAFLCSYTICLSFYSIVLLFASCIIISWNTLIFMILERSKCLCHCSLLKRCMVKIHKHIGNFKHIGLIPLSLVLGTLMNWRHSHHYFDVTKRKFVLQEKLSFLEQVLRFFCN